MSMDTPNQAYPNASTTTASPMPIFLPDPSIKGASFDQLLQNRGVRFIHKKAVPCPNKLSEDNNAHHPSCQFCDDSGILYYEEKEIYGVFSGNSIEKTFEAHGVWEIGSAVVTLPTMYADGTQADFNTYDKLIMPDFEVRLWETKEYEVRTNLIQGLRYPIKKIEFACSIVDNVKTIFLEGTDFTITSDGDIQWIVGREPSYDAMKEQGEVIVYAYFANPVYIVLQSLRELRITQEVVNGQKVAKRLPQQILVKRDFLAKPAEKLPG
jgi:hypothetical protein